MINLLIVEDNEQDLERCIKLITKTKYEIQIFKARSGTEAFDIISKMGLDGALVDIEMPDIDGFELAFRMRKTNKFRLFPIIFITATDNDTLEAYRKYHHSGYIQKPYSELEFLLELEPFLEGIIAQKNENKLPDIKLSIADGIVKIPIDEILYIETISRQTNIVTFDKRYIISTKKLAEVINDIGDSNFMRCHRKCYVNIKKVYLIASVDYKASDIYFTKDGSIKCPLGYKYKKNIIEKFEGNTI